MTALVTAPHQAGNPDLSVALSRQGGDLTLNSTRMRGTRLGLAELNKAVAHYPDSVRTLTEKAQAFLIEHCGGDIARFRGLAIERFKNVNGISYFSNWLKGQYFTGGATNVAKDGLTRWATFCEALIEHDRVTTAATKLGFIETGTTRAIWNHVLDTMDPQSPCRFGAIVGPTGSQKTAGLTLATLKLGFPRAVRFECTQSMGVFTFARKWAQQYNSKLGGPGSKGPVLIDSLRDQIDPNNLVIIHNFQRAIRGSKDKEPIVELLIETQEDKKCPIMLEFKADWWVGMTKAERTAFEQVIGRVGGEANMLYLPDYTPIGDLRAIARAHGIESQSGLEMLADWSRLPGRIRVVFYRLFLAKKWARRDGKDRVTMEYLKEADAHRPPSSVDDDEGGES